MVGSSGLYCLWLEEELGVDDIINTKHGNERLVILHHNYKLQAQPLDDAERSRGHVIIRERVRGREAVDI